VIYGIIYPPGVPHDAINGSKRLLKELIMAEHVLIAYYSHSGNTKKIADLIRRQTGGTLLEIKPEEPYPVSYNTVVEQAKKEIKAGYKPVIKTKVGQWDDYDTVFVGSPNWWSTIAPPIAAFLSENGLSGKRVIPFCTHGGGGAGNITKDIVKLCPNSTVLEALVVSGSGGGNIQADVSAWLSRIGVV
jgi:flavodoxin